MKTRIMTLFFVDMYRIMSISTVQLPPLAIYVITQISRSILPWTHFRTTMVVKEANPRGASGIVSSATWCVSILLQTKTEAVVSIFDLPLG